MVKIINKKEKAQNRHWKNFLDKGYLGSHNLEKDEEMLLTIEKFAGEELVQKVGSKTDEKVPKPVLYFKEQVPKMILNITNGNTIASLYGTHPEQWIGKQIQIYATPVRAFGKTDDALRIRDFIPKINVNKSTFTQKLEVAKDQEELKKIWQSFPQSVVNDPEMIKIKDNLKNVLK